MKEIAIISEVLETIVNSLPLDPADQARLKERVVELKKHTPKTEVKKAPTKKPSTKRPTVTVA